MGDVGILRAPPFRPFDRPGVAPRKVMCLLRCYKKIIETAAITP